MNTKEKYKKKKNTKHIHITHTHTHTPIHTEKKRERNRLQHILLYLHEKINKWSKRRKDRTLVRFIFAPFHIVGLQLTV